MRISRLKKKKAKTDMRVRVLGKSTNKNETWVADSGTSVSNIPVNIAKRNGIKWSALDPEKPNYKQKKPNQIG